MNIFFIGDELIAGYGDARRLGWTGRVLTRTADDPPLMPVHLAVRGEGTAALSQRWADEVSRRIRADEENRLVIGLGSHDLEAKLSSARSRLNLANILDGAARLKLKTFVVGPPPRQDFPEYVQAELTHAFQDVATRRDVPFVDTFTPLYKHEQWITDQKVSHSYEPRQAGYGLIAWLVLHNGWNTWLGVPAAEGA